MTVGWSIIGIGVLSDRSIAPSIGRMPDSELVAVCSRDLGRASDFATRHGGAKAYDDYIGMLADEAVEVVYVATPNGLHREHVLAALEAGKHVLVEKPMALTVEDARVLVDAAAAADRRLGVGFHMRHKRSNREARRMIAEGRIGEVAYVDVAVGAGKDVFPYGTWRSDPAVAGGGTLLNQGTHAIDLVTFLTGSCITEVTCAIDRDPLEEVAVATCRLADGGLATLASNQVLDGTRRDWMIVGTEGWLLGRGALGGGAGDEVVLHRVDEDPVTVSSERSAHDEMIDDFTNAVLGAGELSGTGTDGLRNVAVVEALYRSAREGRSVEVDPV